MSATGERISMADQEEKEPTKQKSGLRAFWDWFVLFSGISTASNLSRTRKDPVQSRGLFLFRRPRKLD
jgi:hypothetical protein